MSATGTIKSETFIGQGNGRIGVIVLFATVILLVVFGQHIPYADLLVQKINTRTEAGYSALFTFLTVFWAAVLTIWSLLKSRATRYVERLAENVVFIEFMRALEIRLVIGMAAVVLSFVVYIINPTISLPADNYTYLVGVWVFVYATSIFTLIDSLLTARILL